MTTILEQHTDEPEESFAGPPLGLTQQQGDSRCECLCMCVVHGSGWDLGTPAVAHSKQHGAACIFMLQKLR